MDRNDSFPDQMSRLYSMTLPNGTVGRFHERCNGLVRVKRTDIKLHLCGTARAKDANIRQALVDRLGAAGTKKNPGPLFGVKSHLWAALAVAVYSWDTWEIKL